MRSLKTTMKTIMTRMKVATSSLKNHSQSKILTRAVCLWLMSMKTKFNHKNSQKMCTRAASPNLSNQMKRKRGLKEKYRRRMASNLIKTSRFSIKQSAKLMERHLKSCFSDILNKFPTLMILMLNYTI